MSTEIHFINVGCGNMTLLCLPGGVTYLYDCNVTSANERSVLDYLRRAMNDRIGIDVFVCSHRDADHMRGIGKIHRRFPIRRIEDPEVAGTTPESPEYREYMDLRRRVESATIKPRTYRTIGTVVLRFMNGRDDQFSDANDQSVVLKVEDSGSSALLAGDTSFLPWRDAILPYYEESKLKSSILLAAHHGSLTFFDDPQDTKNYYTAHIRKIAPEMTIISVGDNVHGLPDAKALAFCEKYSSGSKQGKRVFRTDREGNMKLTLKDDGSWSLNIRQ